MAFHKAAEAAGAVILEPIIEVEIVTPEAYMGDVMGDLNHRRGKILGMEQEGAKTHIKALVPQSELYKYATTLRSITQGRAFHTRKLSGYEEVPAHIQQKIIETSKKEKEEVSA
jgi:elongation factor G